MFCGCALSFGEEPNTLICPVCLGHPGTLPVTNAEAVHYALMIAMAFDCEIAPRSIFHRKNYFYPDLPKGYQISQYDIPLGRARAPRRRAHPPRAPRGGRREAHPRRRVGAHPRGLDERRRLQPRRHAARGDRDRARPAPRRAEAADFGRLLQATLRRMGVSDVNMEEGSLRMDANVSIRPAGTATLGTKTELKNMNSFRFLERGIEAEIARQEQILRDGGEVEQETLHYDPQTRHAHLAALEGGGARLPLLPRARPGADRADRGDARARPRGAAGAAGRAGGAARARAGAARRDGAAAGVPLGARRLLRVGASPAT